MLNTCFHLEKNLEGFKIFIKHIEISCFYEVIQLQLHITVLETAENYIFYFYSLQYEIFKTSKSKK